MKFKVEQGQNHTFHDEDCKARYRDSLNKKVHVTEERARNHYLCTRCDVPVTKARYRKQYRMRTCLDCHELIEERDRDASEA